MGWQKGRCRGGHGMHRDYRENVGSRAFWVVGLAVVGCCEFWAFTSSGRRLNFVG